MPLIPPCAAGRELQIYRSLCHMYSHLGAEAYMFPGICKVMPRSRSAAYLLLSACQR